MSAFMFLVGCVSPSEAPKQSALFQAEPMPEPPAAAMMPDLSAETVRFASMDSGDHSEWAEFRRRFVTPEGRVIDTGNNNVSHTEGQGWGMLFAVAFDDPETFDRILGWTALNLRRRGDSLHAWRYDPAAQVPVADLNNATDGDIFIASALWRAAHRWGRPDHAIAARTIARDVLKLLVRRVGGRTVLLPAAQGFEKDGFVNVNTSYYFFPLLADLEQAMPSPAWAEIRRDGLALINEGRFGSWKLPPDWLSVSSKDGSLTPAHGWPARFSFDAVRVPLYLAWAKAEPAPLHDALKAFWASASPAPAWVDLQSGAVAGYAAPAGMQAVAQLATTPKRPSLPHGFPSVKAGQDYYSSALVLLSRLAWKESVLVA